MVDQISKICKNLKELGQNEAKIEIYGKEKSITKAISIVEIIKRKITLE